MNKSLSHTRLALLLLLMGAAGSSWANFKPQQTFPAGSIPTGINYQGRLTNEGAVVSGPRDLRFRLYNHATAGALLWESPIINTQVSDGVFGTVLNIPTDALMGPDIKYLEFEVANIILLPREPLRAVPYARIAEVLEGNIEISSGSFNVSTATLGGEALFVSSETGNIGIGTTSPAAGIRLHISGGDVHIGSPTLSGSNPTHSIFVPGNLVLQGSIVGSFGLSSRVELMSISTDVAAGQFFKAGEAFLTSPKAGRMGIRTQDPTAALHVEADSLPGMILGHATNPVLQLQTGGTPMLKAGHTATDGELGTIPSDHLILDAGGSEILRITSGGSVGISSTAPSEKLDVTGQARITGALSLGTPLPLSLGGTGGSSQLNAQNAIDMPSSTGVGASGTWNINVGTAAKFLEFTSVTPSTCPAGLQFMVGIQKNANAAGCAPADTSYPKTDAFNEPLIYDNDNTLTSPWTMDSPSGNNDIVFDSPSFFIDTSADQVGIGTLTPGAKLGVGGQVKITGGTPGAAQVLTTDADGLATWELVPYPLNNGGQDTGGKLTVGNTDAQEFGILANGERVTIQSDGDVGIGTTSPGTKLEVAGQVKITGGTPGAAQVLTSDAAGLATWEAVPYPLNNGGQATGAKLIVGNTDNFDLVIMAGAGSSVTITASGNVAISTTDTSAKLVVPGQVKITGGTPAAGEVLTSDADGLATWEQTPFAFVSPGKPSGAKLVLGNTLPQDLGLVSNGSTVTIKALGSVGIGTTSPGEILDVQGGNIHATGKIKEGGWDLVPTGAIAFSTQVGGCPAGWVSYTAGIGRIIVGGGTPGVTVGSVLGDQGTVSHTHTLNSHTHNVSLDPLGHTHSASAHTHGISAGTSHNHSLNSHTHGGIDAPNHGHTSPTHNHTANFTGTFNAPNGDDITRQNGGAGATLVPFFQHNHNGFTIGNLTLANKTPSDVGNTNPGATGSDGPNTANTNSVNYVDGLTPTGIPSANIANASAGTDSADASATLMNPVDHTMPYLQLFICEKT